jgi:hypothetical protein
VSVLAFVQVRSPRFGREDGRFFAKEQASRARRIEKLDGPRGEGGRLANDGRLDHEFIVRSGCSTSCGRRLSVAGNGNLTELVMNAATTELFAGRRLGR